jgi:hypothetical protein
MGMIKPFMWLKTRKRVDTDLATEEEGLALNRRLRDLRAIASTLKRSRMTPLQVREAIIEKRLADRAVRAFFSGLLADERHYWIASLYALLMPKAPAMACCSFHASAPGASRRQRHDGGWRSAGAA